jgi:hypothetical protein
VQHPSVLGRERYRCPTSTSAADSSLSKGHLLSLQLYVRRRTVHTRQRCLCQVFIGAKGGGYAIPEVELW